MLRGSGEGSASKKVKSFSEVDVEVAVDVAGWCYLAAIHCDWPIALFCFL